MAPLVIFTKNIKTDLGTIGLGGRDSPQCIHADLDAAVRYLDSDLTFVHSGEVNNHFLSLYLKLYLCV